MVATLLKWKCHTPISHHWSRNIYIYEGRIGRFLLVAFDIEQSKVQRSFTRMRTKIHTQGEKRRFRLRFYSGLLKDGNVKIFKVIICGLLYNSCYLH